LKANFYSTLENAVAYYNDGVVAVNYKVVGLATRNLLKEARREFTPTEKFAPNYITVASTSVGAYAPHRRRTPA
jgi:hypothetical protein